MIKANIKITSKGSGWQENFSAACRVEQNGFAHTRVFYVNDGDECELGFYGDSVKMSRKGKSPLEMTFKRNGRTACFAGEGSLRCELDCVTSLLEYKQFAHGIKIKLKYNLSGSPVNLDAVVIYAAPLP